MGGQIRLDGTINTTICSTTSLSESGLSGILSKTSHFLSGNLFSIILSMCMCQSFDLPCSLPWSATDHLGQNIYVALVINCKKGSLKGKCGEK